MLNTILIQNTGASGMSGMLMILAMVLVFYFFMIRPQQKKQKEIKKAREAMAKGDKVVTAGGIHGKIREINNGVVTMEIAKGVDIRVDIASVFPAAEQQARPAAKQAKEEAPAEKENNLLQSDKTR